MPEQKTIAISDAAQSAITSLPSHLTERYHDWQNDGYDADLCATLAGGQSPHSMVISCCDSRVNATKFFQTDHGEFFIHRNIANIVPVCDPKGAHHSTAAALEYAVTVLNVSHIMIIGHSACGGIKGGHQQCQDASMHPRDFGSLQQWLHLIKPAYDRLDHNLPEDEQIHELEKLSVIVSLEHLMSYDFIRDAVAAKTLSLHGLWHDIGSGALLNFNPERGAFTAL